MTGGIGFDMEPRKVARLMRNPDNIADLLLDEHPETGECPAGIFADIVNVQRADIRRLADAHGVDVETRLMSKERAAELLAGTVAGDGVELVVMFNELAEKRDKVLQEVLDGDEYDQFMQQKHAVMNTEPAESEVSHADN